MAFIWQIHLYGIKYGKILKIWHLPYLQGNLGALTRIPPAKNINMFEKGGGQMQSNKREANLTMSEVTPTAKGIAGV
jgi:hypothetical protein